MLIGTLVKVKETGDVGKVVAICDPELLVDFEYELELSRYDGGWVNKFDVEEIPNGA